MQRVQRPQTVEVLLRLLVQSRRFSTGVGGAKAKGPLIQCQETRPQALQQAKAASSPRPPFPLQLLAASASVGRPLHRYLANLTRWKQQQLLLLQAREPPLEDFLIKRRASGPQPASLKRRQPFSGAFVTPQQRMKTALERLAERNLLGLPRLAAATGGITVGAPLALGDSSPSAFKAILPMIRSANTISLPATEVERVHTSGASAQSRLSVDPSDNAFGPTAKQSPRRGQIIPACISHSLFPVPDNSAETLAAAAADLCSQLKPRRALLLLQDGSSLRTLQLYMKAHGQKQATNSISSPSSSLPLRCKQPEAFTWQV
ncbi:hypothetical protein, conserved [Eimeria praecox]|uniref:Uncharacterized protein n=1 Tax=Eimeria praecox TaxID=51316 RepID=U6G6L5_9EIME|nr:hypothetical protein, conserved [Eimeria praecox]